MLFDIYTIVGLICIAAALRFYKGQIYHFHLITLAVDSFLIAEANRNEVRVALDRRPE